MDSIRSIWGYLVTVLLTVAALFPVGMMPVSNNLRLEIRFCSENPLLKSQTIIIQRDTHPNRDNVDEPDQSCIFAALAVPAALLPLIIGPLTNNLVIHEMHLPWVHVAPGQGLAAPPPYATGPPFSKI